MLPSAPKLVFEQCTPQEKQRTSSTIFSILQKVPLKTKLALKSTLTQKPQLFVCRLAYEDTLVACGYSDGFVRTFNLNTDNKISQIDSNGTNKQTPINTVRWRPTCQELSSINSVLLVANTNGHLFQYIAKTGKELFHTQQENNIILAMDYAPTAREFATAGRDNTVRIYDEETKTVVTHLKGIKWQSHGHNNRIQALKYSKEDHNIIVSGGWDHNVNVWDIRMGTSISTIFGPKVAGDSVDIREGLVLTGSNRGMDQLQLWDWSSGKVVTKFKWDQQKQQTSAFLFGAQFCNNSRETVIGVGSNEMKMFSVFDGAEMLEMKVDAGNSLYSCDSGYKSNRYVLGGRNGTLYYVGGFKSSE